MCDALDVPRLTWAELDEAARACRCDSFEAHRLTSLYSTFDRLRMARLRMGHLRHETCGQHKNAIGMAIARLRKYERDGNREYLVDAINLIEIEWVRPARKGTWHGGEDGELLSGIEDAIELLNLYQRYGWRDDLVHAADNVELEWAVPTHLNAHWASQDRIEP